MENEDKKKETVQRKAVCTICGKEVDSDEHLAFFRSRPEKDHDDYYCGCIGWD